MKDSGLTFIASGVLAAATVSFGCHAVGTVLDQSVLAAAIQQPVVGTRWPEQAYRVEWAEAHITAAVAAGSLRRARPQHGHPTAAGSRTLLAISAHVLSTPSTSMAPMPAGLRS